MLRWLAAIGRGAMFTTVRLWPPGWSGRQQAERVATTVLGMATVDGSVAVRAFVGAERLACA
jgi:hypothetical protein